MKVTNNFILGDVNRDADERLLPNGSIRDIQNMITNASEGKDVGALENVLGNKLKVDNDLINAEVIGSAVNEAKGLVYYFVTSDNYDYVMEYNSNTDTNAVVLQTNTTDGLLNFNNNKRVINTNVINKGFSSSESSSLAEELSYEIEELNVTQLNQSYDQQVTIQLSENFVIGSVIKFNLNVIDDEGLNRTFSFRYEVTKNTFLSEAVNLSVELNTFMDEIFSELNIPSNATSLNTLVDSSALTVGSGTKVILTLPRVVYLDGSIKGTNGFQFLESSFVIDYFSEQDSDLLAFSGDDNPPRIINIERCKGYEIDEILSSDLNLMKPSPILAPEIEPYFDSSSGNNFEDIFISFAYRYKYKDEYYSSKSSASEHAFTPREFNVDFDTFENTGMQNVFNAVKIFYNTGDVNVTDIELLFKESESLNWNIIETINKKEEGLEDNSTEEFNFTNNKIYRVLPEREYFRSFDNVPLKARSQSYSKGLMFFGNYEEQRDLIDENNEQCKIDYVVDFDAENSFNINCGISRVESNLNTDQRIIIDFSNIDDYSDKLIVFSLTLIGKNQLDETEDEITIGITYRIPENVNSLFDLFSDESFVDLVENSLFNQALNEINVPAGADVFPLFSTFRLSYVDSNSLEVRIPIYNFQTSTETNLRYYESDSESSFTIQSETGLSSIKSNRNYEISQIYLDEEGRKTTSITSKLNSVFIPNENAVTKNTLKVTIPSSQKPPKWAKYYKFAVKKIGDWDNIYSNIFYEDGFYRWVKLEGDDSSKVNIGDDIICKRDMFDVLGQEQRVKVLDKQYFEEDFLKNNLDSEGQEIIEDRGTYIKIKPKGISIDYQDGEFIRVEDKFQPFFSPRPYGAIDVFGNDDGSDLEIGQGSIFDFDLLNRRSGRGILRYEKRLVAAKNYDNIKDFLDAQVQQIDNLSVSASPYNPDNGFSLTQTDRDNVNEFYFWLVRGELVNASSGTNGLDLFKDGSGEVVFIGKREGSTGVNYFVISKDNTKPYILVVQGRIASRQNDRSKLDLNFSLRNVTGYTIFETTKKEADDNVFYETPETYLIENGEHEMSEHLLTKTYNCYVQGNGAESYKIKDKFNANKLVLDGIPTAVSSAKYRKLKRFADITYSTSPFDDSSGVNGLNEFNLSRANFKDDLEKQYGEINKIIARDTDLIIIQEDKISKVLLGKIQLFNSDGSNNLSSTDSVLGQQVAYAGDYGTIYPEGVSVSKNNIYVPDTKRGVVVRVGYNGIFEISKFGLTSYFRNLFLQNEIINIIACYDNYYDVYMVNIKYIEDEVEKYVTWGYKEAINERGGGWVTKQSFNPQEMIGLISTFVSFDKGNLYIHNAREEGDFNKFYGEEFDSEFNFIFSQEPYQRKVYKTLEIDGTDAWDITVKTNLQNGYVDLNDFRYQENIYRAYIRGEKLAIDTNTLSVQGLGIVTSVENTNEVYLESINEELNIGDLILSSNGEIIGVASNVGDFITIDTTNYPDAVLPVQGDYIALAKPQNIETSGLLGYFLEVNAKLRKKEKTEVFSVSSEVFASATNT